MTTNQLRTEATIEADDLIPIIRIARDFAATPAQLIRAHTDPDMFKRWVGPDGMDIRIVEWDARNGGCWQYVASRDGVDYEFRGCFHQITDQRLVQTFTFLGMPDEVALETMTFEDLGNGHTRLHAQSLVDSFEGRERVARVRHGIWRQRRLSETRRTDRGRQCLTRHAPNPA